jgi:hypothetical protein
MNLKNMFSNIFKSTNTLTKSNQPDLEMEMGSMNVAFAFENQKQSDSPEDVIINFQEYEKCKIIENYVSFIDSINYLSLSIVEKQTINFKLFLPDIKIEDIIYLNEDISFVYK